VSRYFKYGSIRGRPSTTIVVNFYGEESLEAGASIEWPALLDTGSMVGVMLPGECLDVSTPQRGAVRVRLKSTGTEISEISIRPRAFSLTFGGIGAKFEEHLGFKADIDIPSFGNFPWLSVYFNPYIDYAIIGTPILLGEEISIHNQNNGTCFRGEAFRGGACWLATALLGLQRLMPHHKSDK